MQLLNCLKKMDLAISFFIPGNAILTGDDGLIHQLIKKRYFNNSCNFFALNLKIFQFGPFPKPAVQQKISIPC